MTSFSIADKVAIVTGGASGLGYCFAAQLLEKGAKGVTLADVSNENGLKTLQEFKNKYGTNKVLFVHVDTTNSDDFENAFKKTIEFFGNVDILINNAGVCDDARWNREVDINLKGTLHGMLLGLENYIPKYKSGSEGVIINVSSIGGVSPSGGIPIYTATKFALHGLTLAWGLPAHYDRTKVRVVGICPGFTNTPLMAGYSNATLSQFYLDLLLAESASAPRQNPEEAAIHLMDVIEKAPPGTMWVIEGGQQPYKFEVPDRFNMPKVTL